ncbi:helix-turn-helix domain-containing protein [Marinococcus halophilus]|uniref:helix-turn-helix domain-containing protein n=1 Tax=Marinococcus halophilus TaxID=1371 RepID=UPI0009A66604|nr:helix-turn-helix transcriptional regulator [Marinococcus halophilus]
MNTLYNENDVRKMLKQARENAELYQSTLADILYNETKMGICDQSYISAVERGAKPLPNIQLLCAWARVTKDFELLEIISYRWNLSPVAMPPIRREFNSRFSNTLLNMQEQIQEAAADIHILERAYNNHLPGGAFEADTDFVRAVGSLVDLIPAVHSVLYAASRDLGYDIQEVQELWTKQQRVSNRLQTKPQGEVVS